jgi:hypothetical protein
MVSDDPGRPVQLAEVVNVDSRSPSLAVTSITSKLISATASTHLGLVIRPRVPGDYFPVIPFFHGRRRKFSFFCVCWSSEYIYIYI